MYIYHRVYTFQHDPSTVFYMEIPSYKSDYVTNSDLSLKYSNHIRGSGSV